MELIAAEHQSVRSYAKSCQMTDSCPFWSAQRPNRHRRGRRRTARTHTPSSCASSWSPVCPLPHLCAGALLPQHRAAWLVALSGGNLAIMVRLQDSFYIGWRAGGVSVVAPCAIVHGGARQCWPWPSWSQDRCRGFPCWILPRWWLNAIRSWAWHRVCHHVYLLQSVLVTFHLPSIYAVSVTGPPDVAPVNRCK